MAKELEQLTQPEFEAIVLAAQKFYGAVIKAQEGFADRLAGRVSQLGTKSYCDEFLMKRFDLDSFAAHSISNHLTSRNLPPIDDDPENYQDCAFYSVYEILVNLNLGVADSDPALAPLRLAYLAYIDEAVCWLKREWPDKSAQWYLSNVPANNDKTEPITTQVLQYYAHLGHLSYLGLSSAIHRWRAQYEEKMK